MRKVKVLLMSLACGAALAISAAGITLNPPQNTNQSGEACCDMENCCKAGDKNMSCCKKKTKRGKNAHACCAGKGGAACCCKGDSCPMPNKKTGTAKGD
jgi:hypothetical protein